MSKKEIWSQILGDSLRSAEDFEGTRMKILAILRARN